MKIGGHELEGDARGALKMIERVWTLVVNHLVDGFEATRGQMLVQNGRGTQ